MLTLLAPLLLPLFVASVHTAEGDSEWISLFNGKDLDGWKPNENPETFRVKDGAIVAHGRRSHLFYVGAVHGGDFKNFELQATFAQAHDAGSVVYYKNIRVKLLPWGSQSRVAPAMKSARCTADGRNAGSCANPNRAEEFP
jgi:hypothetical protein